MVDIKNRGRARNREIETELDSRNIDTDHIDRDRDRYREERTNVIIFIKTVIYNRNIDKYNSCICFKQYCKFL